MTPLTYAILAFVAFTYFTREGYSVSFKKREKFGKLCVKYDPDEPLDDLPDGKGRECKGDWDGYRYCQEYDCPTVKCRNPKKEKDGCMSCPKQCQWGGKIYRFGARGTCIDGCNSCTCYAPYIDTTSTHCSHVRFCSPLKEKKSS